MSSLLRVALARLAGRPGRTLLAAGGIAAAAAMLGAATTVAFGLATGFDRAADRAGLPDAMAQFDAEDVREVRRRALALPNVRSVSFRLEDGGVEVYTERDYARHGKLQGVRGGERGYAIVEGRDVRGRGEVVVERGLQREWGIRLGERVGVHQFRSYATFEVVGVAVTPDNVAFPLANGPRLYAHYEDVREFSRERPGAVNIALLWVQDPEQIDLTLSQARVASFGIDELEFVTRDGVHTLINQAAGIVIALLVAFSLVALGAALAMLGSSSAADIQRRLVSIGLLRTLGATPRAIAASVALEGALVAALAGGVGLAIGAIAVHGPTDRLLVALNELGPGAAIVWPLLACLAGLVLVVAVTAAWPAWRAASRPPVETLGGADLVRVPARARLGAGSLALGVRLALSRPRRTAATIAVLAAASSIVLLMLALAGLLQRLQDDPETVGKRYRLSVPAAATDVPAIRALPGVAGATARYEVQAADSFALGQAFSVIGFAGDHVPYEAPPLASGRRLAAVDEVEVGLGLAQALNLSEGATLAAQLPSGREVRFRVSGVVRALENEGRVAYVRASRLLAAEPFAVPEIAVLIEPGATKDAVATNLRRAGFFPRAVGGVTARGGGFLEVLAALLRSFAVVIGAVCLYVLVQTLTLTAQERIRALAVLRTLGAGRGQVTAVLAGTALLIALCGAAVGAVLERFVVAPAASGLAASYVSLSLVADARDTGLTVLGLALLAVLAAAWVARGAVRRPIVAGLREE